VHHHTEVDQENDDKPAAIRRSTRPRNPPQIYIQSSALNPSVLYPIPKKKVSDKQSSQATMSSKENNVEESKSKNKRKATTSSESNRKQARSSQMKRRTSIVRQSNNEKEVRSRKKIETKGSSKKYDQDEQILQQKPRSLIKKNTQEESRSLRTMSLRSDILKPDQSLSKKSKSGKKNIKNGKNNAEAEGVFAQPMLSHTIESNSQKEITLKPVKRIQLTFRYQTIMLTLIILFLIKHHLQFMNLPHQNGRIGNCHTRRALFI
ncbi:hypothetical protein ILUMI_26620, partial [Ignelater luminosus]